MPVFEFSRFDGSQRFRALAADVAFDKLADLLLEHGEYILRQLENDDTEDSEIVERLIKEGFLERDDQGRLVVSQRGVRRLEIKALEELFTLTRRAGPGKHGTDLKGAGQVRHDDSRPYAFGDSVANLDLHGTLKNAMCRQAAPPRGRLAVAEEDLVVHESHHETSCATALLLDMSGSMARYGKFYHAKKVALALLGLLRSRYTTDTLHLIGFYTMACPLSERGLLSAGPKPVSLFDNRVFLRVPLDNPPADAPEHFTNIQAGLRLARQTLGRQAAANKQIICITDGEPTAHLEGTDLVLTYPPSERTTRCTLEEVRACARAGIQLSTFALIEDYFYLGLVNFVDQMARTARGLAVYCNAGELGGYVLENFVGGRRSRQNIR